MIMDNERLAAQIERVIEGFDFGDYGMDEVSYRIETDRGAQEWIAALAREIAAAVTAPIGQMQSRWKPLDTPTRLTEGGDDAAG
jgi:hypothetical protein